jgi:hypothetical protein
MKEKKINVLKTPFNELLETAIAEITKVGRDYEHYNQQMLLFGKYKVEVKNVYGTIYIRKTNCFTSFPIQHSLYIKLNATISSIPALCFVVDENGNRDDTNHKGSYNHYAMLEEFLKGIIEYETIRADGKEELSQIIKDRKKALDEKRDMAKQGFFTVDDKVLKEIIKKNNFGNNNYAKSIIKKGMRFFVFADVYRESSHRDYYEWISKYINIVYLNESDEFKCISLEVKPRIVKDLRREDKISFIKLFLENYQNDKDITDALETILAFESI